MFRLGHRPEHVPALSVEGLFRPGPENQTDEQFNAHLESSIEQIYQASVHKQPTSPRGA